MIFKIFHPLNTIKTKAFTDICELFASTYNNYNYSNNTNNYDNE